MTDRSEVRRDAEVLSRQYDELLAKYVKAKSELAQAERERDDAQETERIVLARLASVPALVEARKAIGLLRSMVLSGEAMSKQAEDQVNAGLAAIATVYEQSQGSG